MATQRTGVSSQLPPPLHLALFTGRVPWICPRGPGKGDGVPCGVTSSVVVIYLPHITEGPRQRQLGVHVDAWTRNSPT